MNAAFNIAAASLRNASGEYLAHWEHQPARLGKKELKRQLREQKVLQVPAPAPAEITGSGNLLAVLEQG